MCGFYLFHWLTVFYSYLKFVVVFYLTVVLIFFIILEIGRYKIYELYL